MIVDGIPDQNRVEGATLSLLYVWDEAGFVFSFDLKDHDPGYYEEPHWSQLLASASTFEAVDLCCFRQHLVDQINTHQVHHQEACYLMYHDTPEPYAVIRGLGHHYQVDPSNQPCTRNDNEFLRRYRFLLQQIYDQFKDK